MRTPLFAPHRSSARRFLVSLALVSSALLPAGCIVELDIPDDAQIECENDADCPEPMTCQVDAKRCALPGVVFDTVAPQLTGATSSAALIGAAQSATVTLTATEDLGAATVTVEGDGAPLACTISGTSITCDIDAAGRPAGDIALDVVIRDVAGNEAPAARVEPGLAIDPDAPEVRQSQIVVRPSPDNVLFPGIADAARGDSTVLVDVAWDEAPTRVGNLELTDGNDLIIAFDVAIEGAGGLTSSFALGAAELGGLFDGSWAITLEAEDAVGNVARRTLDGALVVDTTSPGAPVLELLRRAPFGDEDDPAPATHAEGTSSDGLLVLALPAGVVVDPARVPAHVVRAPILDDGTWTVDVGLDVPGLQAVAVDAAGNLSAASTAQRTALVASTVSAGAPHALLARPVQVEHLVLAADERVDDELRAEGAVTTKSAVFWRPLTTVRQDPFLANAIVAPDPIGGGLLAVADGSTFRIVDNQVIQLDVPPLPVRARYAMAADVRRGRVVLFGGKDGLGRVRNDLLEWDGTAWRTILTNDPDDTSRPSPRDGHSMAFVEDLGGVVVVGGCGADDTLVPFFGCPEPIPLEVWSWDGTAFESLCAGAACGEGVPNIRPTLVVDRDGALLAAPGLTDSGPPAFLGGAARIFRFTGTTFEPRCDGACGDAMPFDGIGALDVNFAAGPRPVFVGECASGPCMVHVDVAGNQATAVALASGITLRGVNEFQQAAAALDDQGRLLNVAGNNPGRVEAVALVEAEVGLLTPRQLAPRCGGAAAVVEGEVRVYGGCTTCIMDDAERWCQNATVTEVEAPLAVAPGRGGSDIVGNAHAIPIGDDTLLFTRTVNNAVGTSALFRASDLSSGTTLDLGPGGYLSGGFSLDDNTALLAPAVSRTDVFPAEYHFRLDVLRLNTDDTTSTACDADCAINFSDGRGTMFARTRGGAGLVFGGGAGDGATAGETVLVDAEGQGTRLVPAVAPPPRAHGNLVYDPEREVTWLFGGLASTFFPGQSCAADGSPVCTDLWTFDGAEWREVRPPDVLGLGAAPPRTFAQAVYVDGGLVVTGGVPNSFVAPRTDAWRLEASTTQAMAHLLRAGYASYGPDARQVFAGVSVRWCGSTVDATGAPAPVGVRLWAGGRFVDADVTVDGACVDATFDDVTETIVDGDGTVVVEVAPRFTQPGASAAELTTERISLTTLFVPAP